MSDLDIRVLATAGVAAVAAIGAWLIANLVLRNRNFKSDGTRRTAVRGGDRRSQEIEYHNLAIYRDFEYFFKVTLPLLGGVAFLATREGMQSQETAVVLIRLAGWLSIVAALLFSFFIFFHQKSKIERWDERFDWLTPLCWQECWMITGMVIVSSVVHFTIVPALVAVMAKS